MTTPVSTDVYRFLWGDRTGYHNSFAYKRIQRQVLPKTLDRSIDQLWHRVGQAVYGSVQHNLQQADLRGPQ